MPTTRAAGSRQEQRPTVPAAWKKANGANVAKRRYNRSHQRVVSQPMLAAVEGRAVSLVGSLERLARWVCPGALLYGTGQRTSGQMAKEQPDPEIGSGDRQATRRSPTSAGLTTIRRSSAATPSSTARFSFIRLE